MKINLIIVFALVVVISNLINSVFGQNFMPQPNMERVYIIDTITVRNAYEIIYYKKKVDAKLYKPDEDLQFYYPSQRIITNDSCMNEIQSKGLKIKDVYPNCAYYTMSQRDMITLMYNNDFQIKTSKYEYINANFNEIYKEVYTSDSLYIYKFKEPETIFYVFLMQARFFNAFYGEYENIADGNYVLVLIPKKPKQYIENDE